jgi:hypothetical protein
MAWFGQDQGVALINAGEIMVAYACRIIENNFGVIASEKPDFDMKEIIAWINEHKTGYFIRDPDSVFDCKYMHDTVFFQIYRFDNTYDEDELFRRAFNLRIR